MWQDCGCCCARGTSHTPALTLLCSVLAAYGRCLWTCSNRVVRGRVAAARQALGLEVVQQGGASGAQQPLPCVCSGFMHLRVCSGQSTVARCPCKYCPAIPVFFICLGSSFQSTAVWCASSVWVLSCHVPHAAPHCRL